MTAIALDIGGSKIAAARIDSDGAPGEVTTVATPAVGVWPAVAELLRSLGSNRVTRVGISAPGPVDLGAGSVAPINIAEWRDGFALMEAVSQEFGGAEVRLGGDGGCAALGESVFGAGRGVPDLLGVVVSTGIGGGVVLDGGLVTGRSGNAGHVGHVVVPGGEEVCACGGVGCVETVASGPAAVRWARARGWAGRDGRELARDAASGDSTAVAALARAGTALGQALAGAAATLDVGLVVVGGGFAESGAPLWDPLRESLARHARLRFLADLQVVPARLGARASLAGAAVLTGA
jgi:glucokinase